MRNILEHPITIDEIVAYLTRLQDQHADPAPGDPAPGDPACGDPACGDPACGDMGPSLLQAAVKIVQRAGTVPDDLGAAEPVDGTHDGTPDSAADLPFEHGESVVAPDPPQDASGRTAAHRLGDALGLLPQLGAISEKDDHWIVMVWAQEWKGAMLDAFEGRPIEWRIGGLPYQRD